MESSTRALSRKTRVYEFRNFCMHAYGDYLSKGDIVLDMAGGKGDLSWLLCNVDDLDSIVVDPRVTKNHLVKSVHYLREHPEQVAIRAIPNQPTYQPLAALMPKLEGKDTKSSRHLRILVDEKLVAAIRRCRRQEGGSMVEWKEYWEDALQRGSEAQPLGYREDTETESQQILNYQDAFRAITSAKLIVGFHPDQATDASMDLALELGIPFCVVPCCVFPTEFPDRRLEDGSRVRCYTQLIQYLKTKGASIQTAKLNFHFTETAKNLALYTLPAAVTNNK